MRVIFIAARENKQKFECANHITRSIKPAARCGDCGVEKETLIISRTAMKRKGSLIVSKTHKSIGSTVYLRYHAEGEVYVELSTCKQN